VAGTAPTLSVDTWYLPDGSGNFNFWPEVTNYDPSATYEFEEKFDNGLTQSNYSVYSNYTQYSGDISGSVTIRCRSLYSSLWSNAVTVEGTAAPIVPNPNTDYNLFDQAPQGGPGLLQGGFVEGSRVELDWSDYCDNETGFQIQRSTTPDFSADVVNLTAPADAVTWIDSSLEPGVGTYWYQIAAENAQGMTGYTNAVEVAAPDWIEPAAAPSSLQARAAADDSGIDLA